MSNTFQEPTGVGSRFRDGVIFFFPAFFNLFSRITSALDHFYHTPQEQHKVIIVAGLLSVSRSFFLLFSPVNRDLDIISFWGRAF